MPKRLYKAGDLVVFDLSKFEILDLDDDSSRFVQDTNLDRNRCFTGEVLCDQFKNDEYVSIYWDERYHKSMYRTDDPSYPGPKQWNIRDKYLNLIKEAVLDTPQRQVLKRIQKLYKKSKLKFIRNWEVGNA